MERDPIPISALEHFEYCARQCALILVDGLWSDNRHTISGQRFHRRADSPSVAGDRNAAPRRLRALALWSDRYALVGRADVVEVDGPRLVPVEFKAGVRHGLTADVQLCAQAFCLEEMFGRTVEEGAIWYGGTRRRRVVDFDDKLRRQTEAAIAAVHALSDQPGLPVAPNDQRCQECQLQPICIPERTCERSWTASAYVDSFVFGG